ncbi:MAG: phage tail tube protein [Synergistaceae bacterium]
MAIGNVKAGYMGIADIDGQKIRCTEFSVNPKQEPLFYDHIVGLRDSTPDVDGGVFQGKADIGALNAQKIIWRPGVKTFQGGMSFPLTDLSGASLFNYARTGSNFILSFQYDCNEIGRTYSFCKINSYTFSVSAGDICNVQVDIMAIECVEQIIESVYEEVEKLVTWDDVKLDALGTPASSFTFTINNNCKPIYTAGVNEERKLSPAKIRVGMQEITGSMTFYNKERDLSFMDSITDPTTISLAAGPLETELNVIFKPIEISGRSGPVLSTLAFVGVDHALGDDQ